jgi:hypothetical protein
LDELNNCILIFVFVLVEVVEVGIAFVEGTEIVAFVEGTEIVAFEVGTEKILL